MSNTAILFHRRHAGGYARIRDLCITPREPLTITFVQRGTGTLQYSTDDAETWTNFVSGQPTPTFATGAHVYLRGNVQPIQSTQWDASGIGTFSATGQFDLSGCALSLIEEDNWVDNSDIPAYAFGTLFYNCQQLVDASAMVWPSGTAKAFCCENMFNGCSNLVAFSAMLPSMTLESHCYVSMFRFCGIYTAPTLPAITSAAHCYEYMFNRCNNLSLIRCYLQTFASACTQNWVLNVSPNGVFYKSSIPTWTTGQSGIPSDWITINID